MRRWISLPMPSGREVKQFSPRLSVSSWARPQTDSGSELEAVVVEAQGFEPRQLADPLRQRSQLVAVEVEFLEREVLAHLFGEVR